MDIRDRLRLESSSAGGAERSSHTGVNRIREL
jgi:hypothetical protein